MSKKIKYVIITFVLACVVAVSAIMSACTIKTNHPQAKITVSFNNETYVINYKMYRNMYPKTVQHFIELADANFYDNMIVHDYKSGSDWFTGGYSYDADNYNTATFGEYLENNNKEEAYYALSNGGKLTQSVYSKLSYDNSGKAVVEDKDALATLIGEFSDNAHNIEKNALSAKIGCLKMYYYNKGDSNQKAVTVNSFNQIIEQDYKYNCATSLFAMQVGSSGLTASKYCIFAELLADSDRNVLQELMDAVTKYSTDIGANKFTNSVDTTVDKLDAFSAEGGRDIQQTFVMTSLPIVIQSVKITKY